MGPDSVKHQLNGDVNESSEELTGEAPECVAPALGQEGSPGSERGGRECEQVEAAALPVPPVWWGAFPPSHLPVTVLGRPCSSQSPGQACPGDSVGGRSFTGSPASALREPCRVSLAVTRGRPQRAGRPHLLLAGKGTQRGGRARPHQGECEAGSQAGKRPPESGSVT